LTDAASGLIRRHFPEHEIAVPLGFPFEELWVGQIKSQAVKIAARHRMIARWTGMAFLKSFDRSNVLARRFASAARYYDTPFATEAALTLTEENAANGLYEALANGAVIVHDDPQNIFRAAEVHKKLRPAMFVSPPVCRAAVLYPLADELYSINDFRLNDFIDRAAQLRHQCDFDICDQHMIADGYLQAFEDLMVMVPTTIDESAMFPIQQFLRRGGRLWLCGNATLQWIDKHATLRDPVWETQGAVQPIDGWPAIRPFDQLRINGSKPAFYTVHSDCVSAYDPVACAISRHSKPN